MVDFQLIPKIDYLKTKCYNSNVVNNMIEVENIKYKIVKNYRDAFNKEEFVNKFTSFFAQYDFIVGDIAYSKLILKVFNNKDNKNFNKINDSKNIEKYIKENCAYDCRYYILEKIKNDQEKKQKNKKDSNQ